MIREQPYTAEPSLICGSPNCAASIEFDMICDRSEIKTIAGHCRSKIRGFKSFCNEFNKDSRMGQGVFALLERSLRVDARALPAHLARLGLIGTIYLVLWNTLSTSFAIGAPGLNFFEGISFGEVLFISILGIGFFSTTIVEEKEEDTLGLMLMAGISPLGILLGKTGGRLWQAILLIVVQFPATLLAITMGGLSFEQIVAATISLSAYLILIAGYGLFCSTIATRSSSAMRMMSIGVVIYFVVPWIASAIHWRLTTSFSVVTTTAATVPWDEDSWVILILSSIRSQSVMMRLHDVLQTGFASSFWGVQVISNTCGGLVAAVFAWALFGWANAVPTTEPSSRGLIARRGRYVLFAAGRPWGDPFCWKDFHFVAGGFAGMLIRSIYYFGLMGLFYLGEVSGIFSSGSGEEWVDGCLVFMSLSVAIDAGLVLARALRDEIRDQTLSTLFLLPRSSTSTVYAKFAGALLAWLPGPFIEFWLTVTTEQGQKSLEWFVFNKDGMAWSIALVFFLIPHYAMVLSLYLRWGAVPVAFGAGLLTFMSLTMVEGLIRNQHLFGVVTALFLLMAAGVCHLVVLLRVQSLGIRG